MTRIAEFSLYIEIIVYILGGSYVLWYLQYLLKTGVSRQLVLNQCNQTNSCSQCHFISGCIYGTAVFQGLIPKTSYGIPRHLLMTDI